MPNAYKNQPCTRRHGKRQLKSILSAVFAPPNTGLVIPTPSVPTKTLDSLSIPTIATTTISTDLSTLPIVISTTVTDSTASSAAVSLSAPSDSSPQSTPPTSESLWAQHLSVPGASNSIYVITVISNAHLVTLTTTTRPSASLSPEDHSSSPFLDNKAQFGAVLAVVTLLVISGIVFLAFRFSKHVQRQLTEREKFTHAAVKVRVRLDDGDDDTYYGGPPTRLPQNTAQYNQSSFAPSGIEKLDNDEIGSSPPYLPYPVPLHHRSGSFEMQTVLDRYGTPTDTYDIADSTRSAFSQRSGDSGEGLLLARSASTTTGGLSPRSNTFGFSTLTKIPSCSATRSASSLSTSIHDRTPSTSVSLHPSPTPVKISQSERSSLPILSLPPAFGEGNYPDSILGDDQDYHAVMGRVLKIVNE